MLPGSCRTKREWRPVLALGPWGTILSPPEGLETAEFLSQPPEASAAVPCQPVSPRGQREVVSRRGDWPSARPQRAGPPSQGLEGSAPGRKKKLLDPKLLRKKKGGYKKKKQDRLKTNSKMIQPELTHQR